MSDSTLEITRLKDLLKQCVTIIDEFDLIHAAIPEDESIHITRVLITAAYEGDLDPNELSSLQNMLENGKYRITTTKK